MYDSNTHQGEYCLLYYNVEHKNIPNEDPIFFLHQTIFYCLQVSKGNSVKEDLGFPNTIDSNFTFPKLKEGNVTSEMLLGWSASIDLAERYEIFLNNDSNSLSSREMLFYNCTSPWFGPLCRFTFDYQMAKSFYDIVQSSGLSKKIRKPNSLVTCYQHLNCQTKLSCLDWREICNGKSECLDDSDENNCWQLEVNQCNDKEFRCHNGLCIPIEFFHDDRRHPDCLDRTDESEVSGTNPDCYSDPTFRCEEHMCRPGQADFPCGDGQCTNRIGRCANLRPSRFPADFCSNATACSMELYHSVDREWCKNICANLSCIKDNCSMFYEFRYIPLLLGHVSLMFSNLTVGSGQFPEPEILCYDEKLCADFLPATVDVNELTCRHFNLTLKNVRSSDYLEKLVNYIKTFFYGCLIPTNEIDYCNYFTMYRCTNSTKCISQQRLVDGIRDCPFNDDETFNESCSLSDIRQRIKCYSNGQEKCFASLIIEDGKVDCTNSKDEVNNKFYFRTSIYFQTICDGTTDVLPVLIDEENETDETKCEDWPCNNSYTRCDGYWQCKNGADEVNCPPSTCPVLQHSCIFPNDTSNVSCLPINQADDGTDNCVGGTDERRSYSKQTNVGVEYYFHCRNESKYMQASKLCNNVKDCKFNDDESFCKNFKLAGLMYCTFPLTNVESFLCKNRIIFRPAKLYFKIHNMQSYPLLSSVESSTHISKSSDRSISKNAKAFMPSDFAWRCDRGVSIRIRMAGNTSNLYCLCPPSHSGDRCQYQNQRVSLTVQIRVSSDWHTVFIFLITLIDRKRNIQSHDHIEYLPIQECRNKFNIYLLYLTKAKNLSESYFVQIDVFNQVALKYRASWIFPLQFPFLPVHRLPVSLKVPLSSMEIRHKCISPCIHGQCVAYINDPRSTFCRCESGWFDVQCDLEYQCKCASGSVCISDSICLCPPGRFERECHLFYHSSNSELCLNGGHYVPKDIRHVMSDSKNYICICTEEYNGIHCEEKKRRSRINISFHRKVPIPSLLLIHFVTIFNNKKNERKSILKKIGFAQYSLVVYVSDPFNIAFVEMSDQYYLIVLTETSMVSANISTEIMPAHRCRSIGELFNETFANQHLLKIIKSYHRPCKEHFELVCFYDKVHFCFCNLDRQANCFEFDQRINHTCREHQFCENEGYCLQDDPKCPTPPICGCHQCYFGSRCQLSTKGAILSLDTILGYHIRPRTGISHQPIIVKVALSVTTFMFALGFTNSFLSFLTFKGQETRKVGCGIYLLASSILSLVTVIVLTMKFCLLLASQIGSINNRSFLYVQCVFIDFSLRCLLSISDWLSACVAFERAVNVLKGTHFDKSKSKQMAKWIISIVLLFTISSYVHDPLSRHLIDDEEEERTWCVNKYSSSLQIFDWLINVVHFLVPFSINCISALIVIISAARIRSNSQEKQKFKDHLREQIKLHRHLLISPLILVVLGLPRLIISLLTGCMKSARESLLYLIGYFISYIPTMMTFTVFVLPSQMYKKQFVESIRLIWQR